MANYVAKLSAGSASVEEVKAAGYSTKFISSSPSESTKSSPELTNSNLWSQCPSESFSLRVGPKYSSNKKKAPSSPSLMNLVAVDIVNASSKIDGFGHKVHIPDELKECERKLPKGIPIMFIVNCQVPSEFRTALFTEITDGPGWSIVFYYRLSDETIEHLQNLETAPPPVKLFAEFCMKAPELDSDPYSPWRGRFKVAVRCENIDQFGLPAFITSYNSKPVLIRTTGSLIRGDNFIEMDINIHKFASAPKKALQIMMNSFDKMHISIGFCIESKEEYEMPETLMGCATIHCPSYAKAPTWP